MKQKSYKKVDTILVISALFALVIFVVISLVKNFESPIKTRVINNEEIEIVKYNSDSSKVIIPVTIKNRKVTSIADGAFMGPIRETIELPNAIKSIGPRNYLRASDVYFDGTIEQWLQITFSGQVFNYSQSNLYLIDENGTVTHNNKQYSLFENLVVPSSITTIKSYAFAHLDSLVSVDTGDGVTTIENDAFFYANVSESFKHLTLGANVTTIGNNAFRKCYGLEDVTLNDRLEYIGANAFELTKAEYFVLPLSVQYIGDEAFSNTKIYYKGTSSDWEAIEKVETSLYNCQLYFYSEGAPLIEGNYWHYDNDGNPVVWDLYTAGDYIQVGQKLYLGSYPQTLVTDTLLQENLNALAGELPTENNLYSWNDYHYYVEGEITSYMYYIDIDIDNDDSYDYRGVYFTRYRPLSTESPSESIQPLNGYEIETTYWFKYEPIEWDVLDNNDGSFLIFSHLILDSQNYYPYERNEIFEHNGGEGYANEYALSDIRIWLNDNFYNTAFSSWQKELIETTTVENGGLMSRQGTYHETEPTEDKMFLLSYPEIMAYYETKESRITSGTDYAKVQGLATSQNNELGGGGEHMWWLRTAYCFTSFNYFACIVSGGGLSIHDDITEDNTGAIVPAFIYANHTGVRIACRISIGD